MDEMVYTVYRASFFLVTNHPDNTSPAYIRETQPGPVIDIGM